MCFRIKNMSKERIKSTQFQTFDPNIIASNQLIILGESRNSDLISLYDTKTESYMTNSIVQGKIIEKTDTGFKVDIAYKSNGFIPFEEFNKIELNTLTIGSTIEVMIDEIENINGNMVLSYERAKATRSWEKIASLYKENKPVDGVVTSKVQGGLCVDIGITAFLPGSQIDTQRVSDFDSWIGKTIQAYIIKLMPKRGNVVISRRKFIYEQKSEARKGIIDTFQEGQVVQGIVKNITKYGAFLDIGGVDGLLHITDMTWSRIEDQTELMNIGDTITVKILSFDKEHEKISLGMKQLTENPWNNLDEKLEAGSIVKGTVISVKDYGIFIEIIKGVEGLIHISEVSWTDRITDLTKNFKVGQEIEAAIVALERKNRRMSLSIKQLEKNPWEKVIEEYKVGQVIKGKVTNIADFGFFVQIAPGVDGLVYVSDISWAQHIKHPADYFTKGQEIEAVIIDINQVKKKIALSIKNLTPNPWDTIQEKLAIGDMVNGCITKIADFGAFVKLDNIDIEAFIHSSECSDMPNMDINNILKLNNNYLFKVIRVSPEEQKIGLSLKKEGRDYDKKYDKKNSEKENRKGKEKNEGSKSQNKKDFNKKNQNKTYTTGTDSKKKSNLQLEVEKLMQQNTQTKE